ncbi:hypothetical protein BOO69_08160 [Sulfitobacter alexandrii]|uniref:Uncharacterized protein n=1 Tax=Sulfitobacter alexandrii TaxID=1917485 RepID=A0A1J0WGE8_9RHOB|nr:hypothetical protein BOO69_08160 [Sulfitobacter alexandrii]
MSALGLATQYCTKQEVFAVSLTIAAACCIIVYFTIGLVRVADEGTKGFFSDIFRTVFWPIHLLIKMLRRR